MPPIEADNTKNSEQASGGAVQWDDIYAPMPGKKDATSSADATSPKPGVESSQNGGPVSGSDSTTTTTRPSNNDSQVDNAAKNNSIRMSESDPAVREIIEKLRKPPAGGSPSDRPDGASQTGAEGGEKISNYLKRLDNTTLATGYGEQDSKNPYMTHEMSTSKMRGTDSIQGGVEQLKVPKPGIDGKQHSSIEPKPGIFQDGNEDARKRLEDLMGQMHKRAEERVEESLKNGTYVEPDGLAPGAEPKAKELTDQLIKKQMFGDFNMIEDKMSIHVPNGKEDYNAAVKEETKDISEKEEDIAKKAWEALSPGEQEKLIEEKLSEDVHNAFIHPGEKREPKTPNLDKFRASLAEQIKELEEERAAKHKDVWTNLPDDEKRNILRRKEQQNFYRAL